MPLLPLWSCRTSSAKDLPENRSGMLYPGEVVNVFLFTRPVTLLWRNFVGALYGGWLKNEKAGELS